MNEIERDFETGQLIQSAAEIYEQFFVPALFQNWPKHIIELTPITAESSVLDVACGTGVLAREAAKISNYVTGVDLNSEMLGVARSTDATIRWEQGNAELLPFEDNSFDFVVSQFGLMFFDDKVKAIREMHRVLKPGGQMTVAVWVCIEDAIGYAAMKSLVIQLFGEELSPSFDAPFVLGDPDLLLSLFNDAGVPAPAIQTLDGNARYPSIEDWVYTDIKGWTLAGALDDGQFDLLLQRAKQAFQHLVQADGTVEFSSPAHIVSANKST
jgi:ubiquinone/menaquinone biosynthesis C-methylase UbiE